MRERVLTQVLGSRINASAIHLERSLVVSAEPMRAFKFARIQSYVLESLRKSTIYFCAASALNDPHDCQIDLRRALGRAAAATAGRRRALIDDVGANLKVEKLQQDAAGMGVWSYTTELNNGLMWAHYGDGHKGLCLFYEFTEQWLREIPGLVGCAPVNYGRNPVTDWLTNELDESRDVDYACVETMKRALTAKSEYWRYEKEGRILRKEPGLLAVPPDSLKQICFGVNVGDEEERRVREAAGTVGRVAFARMRRDDDSDTGYRAEDC